MGECKKTWKIESKEVLEAGQRDLLACVISATMLSGHSCRSKRPLQTNSNCAYMFSPGAPKLKLEGKPGQAGSTGWPWLSGLAKPDHLTGPSYQGQGKERKVPPLGGGGVGWGVEQSCTCNAAHNAGLPQISQVCGPSWTHLPRPPPSSPVTRPGSVSHQQLPLVLRFRADKLKPP